MNSHPIVQLLKDIFLIQYFIVMPFYIFHIILWIYFLNTFSIIPFRQKYRVLPEI